MDLFVKRHFPCRIDWVPFVEFDDMAVAKIVEEAFRLVEVKILLSGGLNRSCTKEPSVPSEMKEPQSIVSFFTFHSL